MSGVTKRLRRLALCLLSVTAMLQSADALEPSKAITQYVHTVWQTDDGLPENSVNRILETSDGYLWVGTQAGIARFDGAHFTVFNHTNTPSLHDDFVTDLVEDRQGTLWIATLNGGVTQVRDGVFSHFDAVGARAGTSLAAVSDGSLWIGGDGRLTHVKRGKVVKVYDTADGPSGERIRRLLMDREGALWLATSGGLHRLAGGKIRRYSIEDGVPSSDVIDLYLGPDSTMWVRTRNSGLVRRAGNGRFESWQAPGIPDAAIRDMLQDKDGNLWFASAEGLLRIRGGQVSRFTSKDGLSSDQVLHLYEDAAGNLWVGTMGGGLDRLRDGIFTTYAKEEGLAADQVLSVIEDSAGDVWAATSAGLNQLGKHRIRVFTTADGLPSNNIWSLWEDGARNLWVGTSTEVIRMRHGQVVQALSTREGIPDFEITGIFEDSAQQLWFSTAGKGVLRYADGRFSAFSQRNGLSNNFIYSLVEGEPGTIWIGSNYGLDSIRNGRFGRDAGESGLANAFVLALYYDARNTLWIGTKGRGLFRLENGRLTRYTNDQGLPDDTINSILEDAAANLWIGSNKGIFRVSRQDLEAVAAGTMTTMHPVAFGRADGMKSSETMSGAQPSAWRARDGRLWFATIRGVVVVDPKRVSLSDRQPPARVERMLADEVPVDLAAPVRLKSGTSRMEIRYTAPNLSTQERTRFRYRLEGFDKQWIPGRAERMAQYTNLPPGHYTFHVSASTETGRWGDQEGILDFRLSPQFYQTWWFRLLYGLFAIALLWGAYRLRVNWLDARTAVLEERQRIAGEIHDSLAQGLSGIIFQTEAALLGMAPGIAATRVTTARDLAKTSLDDARYSVWDLSPPILDQKNLLESLSSMAHQFARGRVEALYIHSSGTEWIMRPEANHHVVLIAQEAISNAIRHGHARAVTILLTYVADGLHLSIADDGAGFAANSETRNHPHGYGMRNMRLRADRLGATLDVTSAVGQGTRVSLRVSRLGKLRKAWQILLGKSIARTDR